MEYYLHATNERATCIIPRQRRERQIGGGGEGGGSQAGTVLCAESKIIYPSPRPTNTSPSGVQHGLAVMRISTGKGEIIHNELDTL